MACVELPKDAEGREIQLDTEVLYDKNGQEIEVSRWQYYPKVGHGYWNLKSVRNKYYRQDEVYLTPPDSWEKLEEDLRRASERKYVTSYCRYFNTTNRCVNCSIHNDAGCCTHTDERAFGDILDRIRKLRGEGE